MSKKIDWEELVSRIPHVIQVKKTKCEVCWIDDFKDGNTLGETRFNPTQIILKAGQTPKEAFSTYTHEVLHFLSDEYDAKLTEKQVLALEKALIWILKPGNLLKEIK